MPPNIEDVQQDDNPILVYADDERGTPQPSSFRCCPLGIQLYTHKQIELFNIIALKVNAPGVNGEDVEIECSGVVVHCQPQEDSLYRLWVKFLDIPESARQHLTCFTESTPYKCPYCENF